MSFILLLAVSSGALQPTTTPPLLDVPTYALATLNKDGSTNMNIMTYATPVSTGPSRVWTLGIYRETLSEENLRRNPTAVLQLLTKRHADLVSVLGGNSGRDIDKRQECAKRGNSWKRCEELDGLELLPGCAAYVKISIQGGLLDAGSHLIAPYCIVQGMYEDENTEKNDPLEDQLKTGYLRELGVITEQGRVANQLRDVTNIGFRQE